MSTPAPDDAVHPFTVAIPDDALTDLAERLDRTRWPADAPGDAAGTDWTRGVPTSYLRELAGYWRHDYDWRLHEATINAFPQFTTTIDGERVHFLHVRSAVPEALPLIMTHGWPGSIVEFLHVIGPLVDPVAHGGDAADAFHVVVPSIPGYGFSGPIASPGWDTRRIGAAFATLMARLGYDRYAAQGGDWGSHISREIGLAAPDHVVGVHLNMLFTPAVADDHDLTDEEERSNASLQRYRRELSGYRSIQATRPQTLAYALTDSPVGQLAWIVEKFREWTDSDTVPEDAVDRDRLLTNVMVYWLTATAGSSAQLYLEAAQGTREIRTATVPTAVAVFPHDLALPVRHLAEQTDDIVRWTTFDRGGHFAALEEPDLLIADVRAFFRGRR